MNYNRLIQFDSVQVLYITLLVRALVMKFLRPRYLMYLSIQEQNAVS